MSSRSFRILQLALKSEDGRKMLNKETNDSKPSKINILSNVVLPPDFSNEIQEVTPSISLSDVTVYDSNKNNNNNNKDNQVIAINETALTSGYFDVTVPGISTTENTNFTSSDIILTEEEDPFEESSSSYAPSDSSTVTDSDENNQCETTQKNRKQLKLKCENRATDTKNETVEMKDFKRKRSKKANKDTWKQTINKKLRLTGKLYVNRSGKEIPEKRPGKVDCKKCRFKCEEKISESQRERLCTEYYSLGDDSKQKIYLSSIMQNVHVAKKKRSPKTKNRETSRIFFLKDSNRESQRVCRIFFCKTFAISHRIVENCSKNTSVDTGMYTGFDRRKNSCPPHATSDEAKKLVRRHIDSFPKIESHYCRKDSKKLYLSPELNISIMYRLYKTDFCSDEKLEPVSLFVYQKIFHEYEPALAFHVPRKDQCSQCNAYNQASDKDSLVEDYTSHKKREQESMDMKAEDKKRAASEHGKTFRSITFDLQAILPIPHAGDSQIYYRHKLNVYNFTVYDASTSDGYCFIWDETHGSKGSAEIGTCILHYLFDLPNTVSHVASFSDTCSGQNRNKYVAAAMLYAVSHMDHLQIIDLKFMESGHSYLEADSMHATIERAKRHKKIYTTREWSLLISASRLRPKPYIAKNLKFDDFFDLQKLVKEYDVFNTTVNTIKEKVNWLKIKWLRFQKDKPSIIQYKYSLTDANFHEIDVNFKGKAGRRRLVKKLQLSKKYTSRLPVSQKKKKDLMYLLKSKVIPEEYTSFINDIPVSNTILRLNEESDLSD